MELQSTTWEILFKITVFGIRTDYTNVFHFNISDNYGTFGDRTPALYLKNDFFHFRFSANNKLNTAYNKKFVLNTEYKIKIAQLQACRTCPYKIIITINNEEVYSLINNDPRLYKNVKCYFSNPWSRVSPAIISDFHYTSPAVIH